MLDEALEIAKTIPPRKLPRLAAILVKNGRVMGVGKNTKKSHPLQKRFSNDENKITLHAEIDCIRNALRKHKDEELSGATMYVARVMKNGQRAIAKPCRVCQKALGAYGIDRVFWTEYE